MDPKSAAISEIPVVKDHDGAFGNVIFSVHVVLNSSAYMNPKVTTHTDLCREMRVTCGIESDELAMSYWRMTVTHGSDRPPTQAFLYYTLNIRQVASVCKSG